MIKHCVIWELIDIVPLNSMLLQNISGEIMQFRVVTELNVKMAEQEELSEFVYISNKLIYFHL